VQSLVSVYDTAGMVHSYSWIIQQSSLLAHAALAFAIRSLNPATTLSSL
jgi:hypothetical protein